MVVRILGKEGTPAYNAGREVIEELGHTVDCGHYAVDIAIAPLLTRILKAGELDEPRLGTLVFHPSLLPYRRGASAIKHTYAAKEPISGVTWFWADSGTDTGDICEQEVIKIDYGLTPRDYYAAHVIPALKRTLKRALNTISSGHIRRVSQIESYATYDAKV